MSQTKIEFAVRMTCESCVEAVKKSLQDEPGIKNVDINLKTNSVVVETTLPTLEVQKKLESSGRQVVVRGFEGSSAGVAIVETGDKAVKGVVRFVQVTRKSCIIDGTIDGLQPGEHKISIHECGDISQGCKSVGAVFNPVSTEQRAYGELGTVYVGKDGRVNFRMEDNILYLPDVIGRSFVVSGVKNGGLACGIIARSAGLFENPKTICACDGITIWNEKTNPRSAL